MGLVGGLRRPQEASGRTPFGDFEDLVGLVWAPGGSYVDKWDHKQDEVINKDVGSGVRGT